MAQTAELIKTLKLALKDHQLTYAEVARRMDMSEANVKRLFLTQRFTLERLEQICHLMQMELSDLFNLYESSRNRITHLSLKQEEQLVADDKLLLVAVSVRNHLSFADIVNNYQISETDCIHCLAQLDKLMIIDLLPGNRIKLRIDENFYWITDGPIEAFFTKKIQRNFLSAKFNQELEHRRFLFGLLSETSVQVLLAKMQKLEKEFTDLHCQDAGISLDKRHSMGFMLVTRPWELGIFKPLLKPNR